MFETVVINILGADVGDDTLGIRQLVDRAGGMYESRMDAMGMRTMGIDVMDIDAMVTYTMGIDTIGVDAIRIVGSITRLLGTVTMTVVILILITGIVMGFLRSNFANNNFVLNCYLHSLIFGFLLTICLFISLINM